MKKKINHKKNSLKKYDNPVEKYDMFVKNMENFDDLNLENTEVNIKKMSFTNAKFLLIKLFKELKNKNK